jgi:hypothetical protein
MRFPVAAFLAFAFVAPALAGCVTPPADPADAAAAAQDAAGMVTAPVLDAAAVLGSVKAFSETYPMRRGDNDAHNGARAELLAGYQALGYEAFEDEFEAPISPTSTPTALVLGSPRLVNICGVKWGLTTPQEWIFVGAHYDVTDGAVYGAYDDASGTMIVQHLAAAFKDVPTQRTIAFCNFDGEEQGLRGSSHIVETVTAGEWLYKNLTLAGMIDFDMAGIMYPASPPLVADVVSPEMQAVIAAKAAALEIPEDMVEYRPISGGNSDNGPFKAAEIPSVLFISNFDEVRYMGIDYPDTYPFWHQLDTYEGMVQMAEGEANLRAGFQNVCDIGSELLLQMANGLEMTFDGPE